jgi:DNA-binding response OmpR family regulator
MPKKILLVEDEKDLASTILFRLSAKGYEVILAYDGQEGLDKARADKPDLIILDLMLPKIDGYKVCALLKSDSRYSNIPILIFSARAQDEDRKKAKEAGADFYMTKPFEPEVLLSKLKELLKEQ